MKAPQVNIISDDAQAISILRKTVPSWIEEMPMLASIPRSDGTSTIVSAEDYNPGIQSGIIAFYFGHNCPPDDRGWALVVADGVSQSSFERLFLELKTRMLSACAKPSVHA